MTMACEISLSSCEQRIVNHMHGAPAKHQPASHSCVSMQAKTEAALHSHQLAEILQKTKKLSMDRDM